MIELVIPTLYKTPNLQKMLPKYLEYDLVSHVHIMDNGKAFDEHFPFFRDTQPKLKIHTPPTYNEWMINKAWNKGVSFCQDQSIVGILNDDVIFDVDVFEYIAYFSEKIGILGMHDTNYKCEEKKYEIIDIPHHCMGWGCAIFFDKWNWSIIPDEIKLFYGDTWQFHMNEVPCKAIKGVPMRDSNISATVAHPEFIQPFTEQYKEDGKWFKELAQQENWNVGYEVK